MWCFIDFGGYTNNIIPNKSMIIDMYIYIYMYAMLVYVILYKLIYMQIRTSCKAFCFVKFLGMPLVMFKTILILIE